MTLNPIRHPGPLVAYTGGRLGNLVGCDRLSWGGGIVNPMHLASLCRGEWNVPSLFVERLVSAFNLFVERRVFV